jgi:hypothetical protein
VRRMLLEPRPTDGLASFPELRSAESKKRKSNRERSRDRTESKRPRVESHRSGSGSGSRCAVSVSASGRVTGSCMLPRQSHSQVVRSRATTPVPMQVDIQVPRTLSMPHSMVDDYDFDELLNGSASMEDET